MYVCARVFLVILGKLLSNISRISFSLSFLVSLYDKFAWSECYEIFPEDRAPEVLTIWKKKKWEIAAARASHFANFALLPGENCVAMPVRFWGNGIMFRERHYRPRHGGALTESRCTQTRPKNPAALPVSIPRGRCPGILSVNNRVSSSEIFNFSLVPAFHSPFNSIVNDTRPFSETKHTVARACFDAYNKWARSAEEAPSE